MGPFAAFLFLLGLETLHVRMPRHCANASHRATSPGCFCLPSRKLPQSRHAHHFRLPAARHPLAWGVLAHCAGGRLDSELALLLGIEPTFLPWPVAVGMIAMGGLLVAQDAKPPFPAKPPADADEKAEESG
jgi:hypothetical protein